ncbi:Zn-ribbon domain-containing OB-fold protein [Thermodesulfobacteriota bacterium]
MEQNPKVEHLYVESVQDLSHKISAGQYLSRYYIGMRDEGKIWANKCPNCGLTILPPRIVCVFCKVTIEDVEENWVQLSDKGTLISSFTIARRDIDPFTGEMQGLENPHIYVLLDGGDERTIFTHILESTEADKARPGMRVEAVWKPRELRFGRVTDIQCFRLIEE